MDPLINETRERLAKQAAKLARKHTPTLGGYAEGEQVQIEQLNASLRLGRARRHAARSPLGLA